VSLPRLLAVSGPYPWPIRGGFALRAAHLLEQLASRWDISLLVGSEIMEEPPWPDPERHEVIAVPTPALGTVPSDFGLEGLRAAAARIVRDREPTAALLFPGTEFLAFGVDGFPRCIADRIDSGTLERFRYIRAARQLRGIKAVSQTVAEASYERRLARNVAGVTVVGEDDARAIRRISGRNSVHVVPNGMSPMDGPAFELEDPVPTVLFSGTLAYYANADAVRYLVRRIWPNVRAQVREAQLLLVGRSPGRSTRALASRPGIEVLADVTDMFALLRRAWVTVAPMRCGAGVKNKVLESWSVGRPAVITPLGANGLLLDDTASELIAQHPDQFCNLIVQLLQDQKQRHSYGVSARNLVRRRHTWGESARTMSRLLHGHQSELSS